MGKDSRGPKYYDSAPGMLDAEPRYDAVWPGIQLIIVTNRMPNITAPCTQAMIASRT